MPGGLLEQDSSIFVGEKLDKHRGAFLINYPMNHGHVAPGGWDDMECILDVSFLISSFHNLIT